MHYWADIHVYIARTFPRLVLTIWFCTVKHAHICHDLTLSCTNMYAMCARMVRTKWQPSRLIYFPTLVRNPLNATFASMPAPQKVVWQDTFALFTHKSYCNSHCRIQVDYSFKCVPIEFKKWMNSNTKSLFVFYFGLFKLNLKTTKKKKNLSDCMWPVTLLIFSSEHSSAMSYNCSHCGAYSTQFVDEMIFHCKMCPLMPRPDPFRCKYVCNECTYGAYNVAAMKNHILTHRGEKPFACQYCNYACAHKSNLNKHVRASHRDLIQ